MMDKDSNNQQRNPDTDEHADDTVSTLMNLAGPRVEIPAALEERVHARVREQWQGATRKRKTARWMVSAALAATVLIVVSFGTRAPQEIAPLIGTVAFAVGSSDFNGTSLTVGTPVRAGDTLATDAASGVTITLAGDVSLRIADNSIVRLDASDEIALLQGQVYADSGERIYRDRHLAVVTPDGTATDIGTQFSVSYEGQRMSVAVREGRVDVVHDNTAFSAAAGDTLTLEPGSDAVIGRVLPSDPSWNWAVALAPEFDTTNRSLMDFLKWAARETGKTLVFSDDDVRMAAMRTAVVGSISNIGPEEAIDAVLSTTRFKYQVDAESITIGQ